MVNNMTGPGIPLLVVVTAAAGSLVSVALLLFTACVAGLSGGFLLEAMAANANGGERLEFMTLAKRRLPRAAYRCVLAAFFFNLTVVNVSNIIESVQTTDTALIAVFGKTCGVELAPHVGEGLCVTFDDDNAGSDCAFGSKAWVLSAGYAVTLVAVVPLGFLQITDNIKVQVAAALSLGLFIVVAWPVKILQQHFHTLVECGHRPSQDPQLRRSDL